MRARPSVAVLCAVVVLPVLGCEQRTSGADAAPPRAASANPPASPASEPRSEPLRQRARRPLSGQVFVLDPGHQLGNARHPRRINRQVNAGGFYKACNTTGTATRGGFPEATLNWRVARLLQRQLRRRGATVYLTRRTNSYDDWGPCITTRGRKGNRVGADAVISIHGDGAGQTTRGFFAIRPANRRGWTRDIFRPSRRLGRQVKSGLVTAGAQVSNSYGGDGFDVRGDLGTLNWSNVPIVMVELGNMRNRRDTRRMTSPRYRAQVYARGLRIGLARFVR